MAQQYLGGIYYKCGEVDDISDITVELEDHQEWMISDYVKKLLRKTQKEVYGGRHS